MVQSDARIIELVIEKFEQLKQCHLPPNVVLSTMRGGPYDGLRFPVPRDQAGNPHFWVYLPVTGKSPSNGGPPCYAWYRHREGTTDATYWRTVSGDPEQIVNSCPASGEGVGGGAGLGDASDAHRGDHPPIWACIGIVVMAALALRWIAQQIQW